MVLRGKMNRQSITFKKIGNIYLISLLVLLALSCYTLQVHIDTRIYHPLRTEDLKYLPSGKFLKGAALAYDELLADILWIKSLAYFGGHYITDKQYDWLHHILEITTTLDPYFEDPYEFGGVVFSQVMADVENSTALLKKGIENVPKDHPRYWYLYFFTAFNYMYFQHDYATAARYLEQAAHLPGSPAYLPLLVARLYANADNPEVAISFLKEMLRSTKSPELQERLARRIKEVVVERDLRILEKVRDRFLNQHNQYPKNINELVTAGLLINIPAEPFGGAYYFDQDHKARSTSVSERLKVHTTRGEHGLNIKTNDEPGRK